MFDIIEDLWDGFVEGLGYIFTFEWFGDFLEFTGSAFEDIGELSIIGIALGLVGVATIYFARDYMLAPFLLHMGTMTAIFWGAATYIGTFMAGYLLGKAFENT